MVQAPTLLDSSLQKMNDTNIIEKEHHIQQEFCKTRPAYRQGRNLTAVKVYTVNSESQHLFIYGVPKINLRNELKTLCIKYGRIISIHVVADHKTEVFTECYHVQYERIQSARIAKRLLDNKSFYGDVLHVCYAPEYESVQETRTKLMQRVKDVSSRIGSDYKALLSTGSKDEVTIEEYATTTKSQIKRKRKVPEVYEKHYKSNTETSNNKRFKSSAST
ncbi:hypothetical protein ILUMI_18196 [Ignelater luminosus]|uniref:RNA-binding protein 48 n=1 Tax=Ignelater luminosus TaxID=2038154 RepID=A0A8K0CPL4_IGNLU|nr:hypothetical protein ILUMI_18196 [Ignelater luminosus]